MNKSCFVISPFGDPYDANYETIYLPAITQANLQPIRGDDIYNTGAIIDDIFTAISSAELVLCDVTVCDVKGVNANVNYELGVAHALQKPAIIIKQLQTAKTATNYQHLRAIVYDTTKQDWKLNLKNRIHETILIVLQAPDLALAWRPKTTQPLEKSERTTIRSDFIEKATLAKDRLNIFAEQIEINFDDVTKVSQYRREASIALGEITLDLNTLIETKKFHGNGVEYDLFQEALAAGKYGLRDIHTALAAVDQAIGNAQVVIKESHNGTIEHPYQKPKIS